MERWNTLVNLECRRRGGIIRKASDPRPIGASRKLRDRCLASLHVSWTPGLSIALEKASASLEAGAKGVVDVGEVRSGARGSARLRHHSKILRQGFSATGARSSWMSRTLDNNNASLPI